MTPEALALCSLMTGRTIEKWTDLTGIEIEACLNDWAKVTNDWVKKAPGWNMAH